MSLPGLRHAANRLATKLQLTLESRIDKLAETLGYSISAILSPRRVYLLRGRDGAAILKTVNENGLIASREILPRIVSRFDRLVVPRILATGQDFLVGQWVLLDWHEGREFANEWDICQPGLAGGCRISLRAIPWIIEVLADLSQISAEPFAATGIERRTRVWLETRIRKQLVRAAARKLFTAPDLAKFAELTGEFLRTVDTGTLRVSNNDFQFRNFVALPDGRIKLIDWDATRISTYETEHCVAYLWMHMWNNPEWQRAFLAAARRELALSPERLRAAMLIVTLNHGIQVWGDIPDLCAIQTNAFKAVLDDDYWEECWPAVSDLPSGSGVVSGKPGIPKGSDRCVN